MPGCYLEYTIAMYPFYNISRIEQVRAMIPAPLSCLLRCRLPRHSHRQGKLRKGQQIAVKRLSRNTKQGELEFKNEVVLMAKLQHRNLVRLLGFSIQGAERLLVYEFVQNGSLDCSVFDPMKRLAINWDSRYKIIKGIAKGLVYLHDDSRLRVIHRDLKGSNVLLDEDNNPKISDFGMARLFREDETRANTRRIVGTYGYMAPEYARNEHFSNEVRRV
ncbi:cysteine-rich receptor-like protein kinase 6 [Salvia splendens]|uniref:cysteine-rich receptor-like protein kinase 6 n=1 Tax=Salvia splendens TaxID=180675 RepID=UPI001C251482|nr:cysteine-rich receptor-like protein kinase 6 [Salvia splendens]